MDFSSIASSLPDILMMLPLILAVSQAFMYVVLAWLFGSVAVRGFRKKISVLFRMAAIFMTGFVCVLAGIAFAGFLPFLSSPVLRMMSLDMTVAGFIVCLALFCALRLITHGHRLPSKDETIESLGRKVAALEDMMSKGKHRHITEKQAMELAEHALKGYRAAAAKLVGSEWEVSLSRGNSEGVVILDAWDGEVKHAASTGGLSDAVRDPKKLLGIMIIAAILIATAVFFEGFPDPSDIYSSVLGISVDDIVNMSKSMKGNPLFSGASGQQEGCANLMSIFTRYSSQLSDRDFILSHIYADDATTRVFKADRGAEVRVMLRFEDDGKVIILAYMDDGSSCYTTDGRFCGCVNLTV